MRSGTKLSTCNFQLKCCEFLKIEMDDRMWPSCRYLKIVVWLDSAVWPARAASRHSNRLWGSRRIQDSPLTASCMLSERRPCVLPVPIPITRLRILEHEHLFRALSG